MPFEMQKKNPLIENTFFSLKKLAIFHAPNWGSKGQWQNMIILDCLLV